MLDPDFGKRKLRATYQYPAFAPDFETFCNLTQLAGNLSATRATVERLVDHGRIKISAVTDTGSPLFRLSEMATFQAALIERRGWQQVRGEKVSV